MSPSFTRRWSRLTFTRLKHPSFIVPGVNTSTGFLSRHMMTGFTRRILIAWLLALSFLRHILDYRFTRRALHRTDVYNACFFWSIRVAFILIKLASGLTCCNQYYTKANNGVFLLLMDLNAATASICHKRCFMISMSLLCNAQPLSLHCWTVPVQRFFRNAPYLRKWWFKTSHSLRESYNSLGSW